MKYDVNLYDLSIEANRNNKSENNEDNDDINQTKERLFKILIKKIKQQLKTHENISSKGTIIIRFSYPPMGKAEPGFYEISNLIRNNEMKKLANDYCIYLFYSYEGFQEYTSYYELLWDFKTYFEQIKNDKSFDKEIKKSCEQSGHNFTKWKQYRIKTPGSPSEFTLCRKRTCKRCKYGQISYDMQDKN